eukprot:GHVO01049202.1.p1 GENE.GHVO01049202.1~~GHVO01049202.1.p1  ORF type:complete len:232 (+),score=41.68 GHVO01049202.1:797-1492(+)
MPMYHTVHKFHCIIPFINATVSYRAQNTTDPTAISTEWQAMMEDLSSAVLVDMTDEMPEENDEPIPKPFEALESVYQCTHEEKLPSPKNKKMVGGPKGGKAPPPAPYGWWYHCPSDEAGYPVLPHVLTSPVMSLEKTCQVPMAQSLEKLSQHPEFSRLISPPHIDPKALSEVSPAEYNEWLNRQNKDDAKYLCLENDISEKINSINDVSQLLKAWYNAGRYRGLIEANSKR